MPTPATPRYCTFTLCRETPQAAARLVLPTQRIPVTGGAEWRVSGEVRRRGMVLEEAFPALEAFEVSCRFEHDGPDAARTPGLMLLDRRFLVWIVLLEEIAIVSIDTELLDGQPRARVRRAHQIIEVLRANGYAIAVDGQTGRVDPA